MRDTLRFQNTPLDFWIMPSTPGGKTLFASRNMNHVAHANEKMHVGVERYLQKVVSAAVADEKATGWRRNVKENAWSTRSAENSFSRQVRRKRCYGFLGRRNLL